MPAKISVLAFSDELDQPLPRIRDSIFLRQFFCTGAIKEDVLARW